MKKADLEKLIGTDHEIRVQAPNSSYPHDAVFGRVIAVDKFQRKTSFSYHRTEPIQDARDGQPAGAHVRVERRRFGSDEVELIDKVVPYGHIHAETRAEHEVRVAKEREEKNARRREQDRVQQTLREQAKNVASRFREQGISVHDNFNGTVSMNLDEAETILQRLDGTES